MRSAVASSIRVPFVPRTTVIPFSLACDDILNISSLRSGSPPVNISIAPGAASAELGEWILDLLSERAAKGCAELLDGRIGPDDCHSPIWPYRFLFLNPLMVRVADRLLGFRNPIA